MSGKEYALSRIGMQERKYAFANKDAEARFARFMRAVARMSVQDRIELERVLRLRSQAGGLTPRRDGSRKSDLLG